MYRSLLSFTIIVEKCQRQIQSDIRSIPINFNYLNRNSIINKLLYIIIFRDSLKLRKWQILNVKRDLIMETYALPLKRIYGFVEMVVKNTQFVFVPRYNIMLSLNLPLRVCTQFVNYPKPYAFVKRYVIFRRREFHKEKQYVIKERK